MKYLNKYITWLKREKVLVGIVLLASVVLFANLGGQGFSLDETGTVTMARGIYRIGFPSGWDGRNLISEANGLEYLVAGGMYIWTWHPPVQSYLAFVPLALFGVNVAALRVPFVLFGIATIIIFYFLARSIWKNQWVAALLSIQLTFLLPFFLYVRQVRYYSPSIFLSLLLFLLGLRFMQEKNKRGDAVLLGVGSVLLFFTNYIVWASSIAAIFPILIWKKQWRAGGICLVTVGIALVWYIFLKPFHGNPASVYTRVDFFHALLRNASYLQSYIVALVFIPLLFFFRDVRKSSVIRYILGWLVVKIVLYSYFLDTHGRYLVDMFPVGVLLYGFWYAFLLQRKKYVFLGIFFCLFAFSNVLLVLPRALIGAPSKILSYPHELNIELTGKYTNVFPQLARYLHKNKVSKSDLFWSDNYAWDIYLASTIPSLSPVCNTKTQKLEGSASVVDPKKVRWFIFFQHDTRLPQTLNDVPCLGKKWQKKIKKDYTRHVVHFVKGTVMVNDPDIVNRQFPPQEVFVDQVVVYEKVNKE